MDFNAENMRQVSEANVKGPAIGVYVSAIEAAVKAAASQGKRFVDPWRILASGVPASWTHPGVKKAIQEHFVKLGFTFTDHPEPDPGHPCSRPFTTMAW